MAQEGDVDINPFAFEITKDLEAELQERFDGFSDLEERDRDAVVTAVAKAAWRGILRGAALYGHAVNERIEALRKTDPEFPDIRVETNLKITGPREPDMWLREHGEEV